METNGFDNGKRMGLRTKNMDKGGGTDSDFDGGNIDKGGGDWL